MAIPVLRYVIPWVTFIVTSDMNSVYFKWLHTFNWHNFSPISLTRHKSSISDLSTPRTDKWQTETP